ncbi:MAG: o-succinylbenzoate--CoA ligase [Deltaproteobacteria bacterium]|nr:MAG: o-succinylbenzoate--CoA ligase [Deltaproteobacteria bacterium]
MESLRLNKEIYGPNDVPAIINADNFAERPDWERQLFLFLHNWWDNSDYIEQQTSGSTGKPKLIRLQKKAMLASAERTCRFFGLDQKSRAVLCLSSNYIAGKMMIIRAIRAQSELIAVAPEGNPYEKIETTADFIAMIPLQAEKMLATLSSGAAQIGDNVGNVLLGGAAISDELHRKITARDDCNFYIGYGMTETCSHIALRKLGKDDDGYYSAMEGVTVTKDRRGCAVIDDSVTKITGLATNDLIEHQPGNPDRFKILGRFDTVINSGGIKFSPEELEKRVACVMNRPFIFSSLPDRQLGQKIIMIVEERDEQPVFTSPREKRELIDRLKPLLPKYAAPRDIVPVPALVRTANGKIDRKFLYI